jgi:hypothetical protein
MCSLDPGDSRHHPQRNRVAKAARLMLAVLDPDDDWHSSRHLLILLRPNFLPSRLAFSSPSKTRCLCSAVKSMIAARRVSQKQESCSRSTSRSAVSGYRSSTRKRFTGQPRRCYDAASSGKRDSKIFRSSFSWSKYANPILCSFARIPLNSSGLSCSRGI